MRAVSQASRERSRTPLSQPPRSRGRAAARKRRGEHGQHFCQTDWALEASNADDLSEEWAYAVCNRVSGGKSLLILSCLLCTQEARLPLVYFPLVILCRSRARAGCSAHKD